MLANMVTAILLKAMSRFFVNNRLIKKINNNIMIKILSSFIESKLPMARYIKYKENIEPKKEMVGSPFCGTYYIIHINPKD